MAPTNNAAWLHATNTPFSVSPSEYYKPGKDEILIKNHALAINPVDWMVQKGDFPTSPSLKIIGNDVAGEVVEVGETSDSEGAKFNVGQRVIGHCLALETKEAKHGAFQEFTVIPTIGCAEIPEGMKYEDAVVLPLAVSTAALGLFTERLLGLRLPKAVKGDGQGEVEALLVWGGSSSVGSTAIQLAVAAGYKVITTASKRNFELCKSLGASEVFDHSTPGIVGDLTAAMHKQKVAGAFDAISTRDTQLNVATVLAQLGGGKMALTLWATEGIPATVEVGMMEAPDIMIKDKGLGKAIYGRFLPEALKNGVMKPAPLPDVVGHGLEKIQEAVDKLKGGVSGSKIVVTV